MLDVSVHGCAINGIGLEIHKRHNILVGHTFLRTVEIVLAERTFR